MKKNVVALGFTSFFTDVSSEMIMVLLPLFLTALGAGRSLVGLIEGVADATASILKVFSGWFSDRLGKRKALVLTGYSLSTLAKPFIAIAGSWTQVLGVRFIDRLGKGLRDAPRDALLADSSDGKNHGLSFGFHRAMDTAGAVVGTLLASLLLFILSNYFHLELIAQYRTIFWISIIPGILAVLTVIFFVKEIPRVVWGANDPSVTKPHLTGEFTRFLLVMGVFELANFSYAIFILRAADLGVAIAAIPLIYLVYNIIYALFSTPVGRLSDSVGRKTLLMAGFLMFAAMMAGFAFSLYRWQAWFFFAVYGIVMAVLETVPKAFVSDLVPSQSRATAFGIYHTTVGLATLPASAVAGLLWDIFGKVNGPLISFSYGAGLALLASLLLWLLVPERAEFPA